MLCADIRGDTAGGFFRIERSSVPAIVGKDMYLTASDGGTSGDRLAAGVPVTSGELVIVDGDHEGKHQDATHDGQR